VVGSDAPVCAQQPLTVVDPYRPSGHGVGVTVAAKQYLPAGHRPARSDAIAD